MLFVISAPSGAGKTTIIKELRKLHPELKFSVSATTRTKRWGENEGKDYYFISKEEFERRITANEFIEWEEVHGNYYGTLKSEVEKCITSGVNMLFDVDVKGALSIKKQFPECTTIFINAPKEDIINRLKSRNTESDDEVNKRIARMEMELTYKDKFDFIVENKSDMDGLKSAVNTIIEIINKLIKKEIKCQ